MPGSAGESGAAEPPHLQPAMHSLLFLCARRLVSDERRVRRSLALLPAELFPALFRAAFLDGRPLVLKDLVASWPFPVLAFRRLLRPPEHCRNPRPRPGALPPTACVYAVILAVVNRLQQVMDEPAGGDCESRCRLRVLDLTGLHDYDNRSGPDGVGLLSGTVALAKACLEASKHQNECLKRSSKRHKGPAGVSAPPQPFTVEVHADIFVNGTAFGVLRDALRATAAGGPLRLRCRDFHAEELSAASTVTLLESLEATGVRRVDLRFNNLGLAGLCVVLPHLVRFADLLSLRLPYSNVDVRRLAPGADAGLQQLAAQLAALPSLKELNFGSSRLSGNLRQLLGDLQNPLESLELAFCYLLPSDLAFLTQSRHAPALRKLDLSGHDFSEDVQPLRRLLEEVSASLLHLDLMECRLTDDRLKFLLPALRRCSRLRCLGLFGNPLTTPGLKNFVGEIAVLPDLRLVIYPYPSDCYDRQPSLSRYGHFFEDVIDKERFAVVRAELHQMLVSSGRADAVWTTSLYRHGVLDFFAL